VGTRSIWRRAHPAGTADGEVRRRIRPREDLRGIVKGEPGIEPGVPESFNVLVRELQSLCLDVELMKRQKPPTEKAAD